MRAGATKKRLKRVEVNHGKLGPITMSGILMFPHVLNVTFGAFEDIFGVKLQSHHQTAQTWRARNAECAIEAVGVWPEVERVTDAGGLPSYRAICKRGVTISDPFDQDNLGFGAINRVAELEACSLCSQIKVGDSP